jgi:hypothetical protein
MLLPSFSLRRSRLQIKVVKRGREENLWVDMRLLPVQWRTFRCATVPTPHLCSQYHRCRNASPFLHCVVRGRRERKLAFLHLLISRVKECPA